MSTQATFKSVPEQNGFSLENQERKMNDVRDIDIEDYLEDMFDSPDQFVILTSPGVQNSIRYVQARMQDNKVEVELGVEENGIHLYYKLCSREECYRIFLDFYDNAFIPDMAEYKPVQF